MKNAAITLDDFTGENLTIGENNDWGKTTYFIRNFNNCEVKHGKQLVFPEHMHLYKSNKIIGYKNENDHSEGIWIETISFEPEHIGKFYKIVDAERYCYGLMNSNPELVFNPEESKKSNFDSMVEKIKEITGVNVVSHIQNDLPKYTKKFVDNARKKGHTSVYEYDAESKHLVIKTVIKNISHSQYCDLITNIKNEMFTENHNDELQLISESLIIKYKLESKFKTSNKNKVTILEIVRY